MQNYYNTFKKVFEQESFKKAIEYVTFLKVEVNKFPKFLADIFKSKFLMNIESSYIFLEKDYIKKLDQDNDKLENFNKITMPRYEKKTYRTFRGLWSALMHKKDVWIENRKKEHTT